MKWRYSFVFVILTPTSFSLSIILTPIVRKIAVLKGHIAEPREDRWNKNPTALFGGIAIFLSFVIPYAIFVKFDIKTLGIMLAGSLIFGVGIFDDIARLNEIKFEINITVRHCYDSVFV